MKEKEIVMQGYIGTVGVEKKPGHVELVLRFEFSAEVFARRAMLDLVRRKAVRR